MSVTTKPQSFAPALARFRRSHEFWLLMVVIVFSLKNVSDKDLRVFAGNELYQSWFHEFEFTDAAGKAISFTGPGDDLKEVTLTNRLLPPGETVKHKVLLNGWKLAGLGHPYTSIGKEPRTIVVKGIYRTPVGLDVKDPIAWLGHIESDSITITIAP